MSANEAMKLVNLVQPGVNRTRQLSYFWKSNGFGGSRPIKRPYSEQAQRFEILAPATPTELPLPGGADGVSNPVGAGIVAVGRNFKVFWIGD